MNDLLLEIGVEELPTSYLGLIKRTLYEKITRSFMLRGYHIQHLNVESTKKRLIIYTDTVDDSGLVDENIEDVLPQMIPEILSSISLPIYAENGEISCHLMDYVTWIQCLYNNKLIDLDNSEEYAKHSADDILDSISSIDDYKKYLEHFSILVDLNRRKEVFRIKARKMGREFGWELKNPEYLIEYYANTHDYPVPYMGKFNAEYLNFQSEIIDTILVEDFNLIPTIDELGNTMNQFIGCVEKDDLPKDTTKIEGALNKRFKEIQDIYEDDLDKDINEYVLDLKGIPYMENAGSYYDKTMRLVELSISLAERLHVGDATLRNIKRQAYLSKADLATKLVQEFPHLKGVMGMIYAQKYGENEIVAKGISEHYKPRSLKDRIPSSTSARIVSVADKLEFLIAFFLNYGHNVFSGSLDTRKASIGIVNTIIDSKWTFDFGLYIRDSLYSFMKHLNLVFNYEDLYDDLYNFIRSKLRDELIKKGYKFYFVDGVMENCNLDIYDIYCKIYDLDKICTETDNKFLYFVHEIESFVNANKRRYEKFNDNRSVNGFIHLFIDQREYYEFMLTLWEARDQIKNKILSCQQRNNEQDFFELEIIHQCIIAIFDIEDIIII